MRQKIAGKSIPDEKFVARKAKGLLSGSSSMVFGFLELAYFFNYTKMGNFNTEIATRWLQFVEQEESKLPEGHEERGVAMLLKSVFYAQLGRKVEAAGQAQIVLKTFRKPKTESYLAPCAMFELGNALRLQGTFTDILNLKTHSFQENPTRQSSVLIKCEQTSPDTTSKVDFTSAATLSNSSFNLSQKLVYRKIH